MPAEPLLRIRGLAVVAGGRTLLRGLDLDVRPGEVVAFQGASGSGKTTLLRTLACLQDPADGTVELSDGAPRDLGWPAWRRRLMLVPQLPVMLADTVGEELAYACRYHGHRKSHDRDRALRILAALRLDQVSEDTAPHTLSVGQQQRLALVRALLLDPTVLLLDEPTSALDPEAAAAVRTVVRQEVTDRGAAALVVSHDGDATARWCDRTIDLAAHLEAARA